MDMNLVGEREESIDSFFDPECSISVCVSVEVSCMVGYGMSEKDGDFSITDIVCLGCEMS